MAGVLYGIGVGPGDPELMTMKAFRLINDMDIIAAPGEDVKKTTAYTIALQAVPKPADKELHSIHMPMVMDRELIEKYHRRGAEEIAEKLEDGKNVGFITLGDPTVYSTVKRRTESGASGELISMILSPRLCRCGRDDMILAA